MRNVKGSLRWLLASGVLLVLTPFAVFPEIMGDVGPRNVPLWRNALGIVLLGIAALGILFSTGQILISTAKSLLARVKNSHA